VIFTLDDELQNLDAKEYYQERRLRGLNLDRPIDESEIVDSDIPFSRSPGEAPWMR